MLVGLEREGPDGSSGRPGDGGGLRDDERDDGTGAERVVGDNWMGGASDRARSH
jgi:hypothetical protein